MKPLALPSCSFFKFNDLKNIFFILFIFTFYSCKNVDTGKEIIGNWTGKSESDCLYVMFSGGIGEVKFSFGSDNKVRWIMAGSNTEDSSQVQLQEMEFITKGDSLILGNNDVNLAFVMDFDGSDELTLTREYTSANPADNCTIVLNLTRN